VRAHAIGAAILCLAALGGPAARAEPLGPVLLESGSQPPGGSQTPAQPTAATQPQKSPTAQPTSPATKPAPKAVEVDKAAGRVSVAGRFTGAVGVVELGACAKGGKTYLSVLALDAQPSQIADATKELGLKPGSVPTADPKTGSASEPTGPKVRLFVEWNIKADGKTVPRRAPLEEFFWNRTKDDVLPQGPWIYAGSATVRDEASDSELFVGDLSGSVATISRMDTSALFYYGGALPSGQGWHANPDLRKLGGQPCRLVIEPVPPPKAAAEAPQPGDEPVKTTGEPAKSGGETPKAGDLQGAPGPQRAPAPPPAPESPANQAPQGGAAEGSQAAPSGDSAGAKANQTDEPGETGP
jgi:hypothetical protein